MPGYGTLCGGNDEAECHGALGGRGDTAQKTEEGALWMAQDRDGLWHPQRILIRRKNDLYRYAATGLVDASAAVALADVLKQRVGGVTAAATTATPLGVAAGRAEGDGGAGGWLLAARAGASAGVCREWHFLAEVTGHYRYL
ncbi:MAG: hypothetical protein SGJ27_08645 [Candidatus Melainabacteria bacterium]|nr:hypothetical protein [Candidatus Melainabacteria bacterium]